MAEHDTYPLCIDEALHLATYQRPGRKIIMGPEAALDAAMAAIPCAELRKLPGFFSWLEVNCGHDISLWTRAFATHHAFVAGRETPTPEDVALFHDKNLSLVQAQAIIAAAIEVTKADQKCES